MLLGIGPVVNVRSRLMSVTPPQSRCARIWYAVEARIPATWIVTPCPALTAYDDVDRPYLVSGPNSTMTWPVHPLVTRNWATSGFSVFVTEAWSTGGFGTSTAASDEQKAKTEDSYG